MSAAEQLKEWAQKRFFGWWIVGASIWIQVVISALVTNSFSTYVAVWKTAFGWSATTFAVAYALQRAMTAVASPVQGWLLERYGPRIVMQAGIVILGVGFMLLARVDSLNSFFAVIVLMAVGTNLGASLSVTTAIVSWFERSRSSALALVSAGVSIGGLLVPLVAWALTHVGWRATATASGVLVLLVALPLTRLMRSSPERYGLVPYGAAPVSADREETGTDGAQDASRDRRGFTFRQAFATRAFWMLSLGHASSVTVVSAVLVHLVVHLNEGLGYSIQTAATVVAVMTGFTLVGQLLGGVVGDQFDKRVVAVVAMFGHAVALLAVTFAPSYGWVLFFAVLHGLAWGMRGPVMTALRADYFGRDAFPTIMGVSVSIVMIGPIVGPLIAGFAADAFGDYRLGFTLLSALSVLGSLFFVFAKIPSTEQVGR